MLRYLTFLSAFITLFASACPTMAAAPSPFIPCQDGTAMCVTILGSGVDIRDDGTGNIQFRENGGSWNDMGSGSGEANPPTATQAEMEAGTESALRSVSPLLVNYRVAYHGASSDHDGRYYTESEVDAALALKVNTSAIGTAASRDAEDTLTNGSNLPSGSAVIAYGDANWGGGSGAPTDASYLTSQAESGLSNENVVSANGLSLVQAADYAAMASLLETALEAVLDLPDLQGTVNDFNTTANNTTDETVYPVFVDGATGAQGAETDTGLHYNPYTGILTAASFESNAADGEHYVAGINTVAITAAATAGRMAYYNGYHYLADGTDWNDYILNKERIDTEAEFESVLFPVVTPGEDDDTPESGDFGNAAALEADGSLSNNSVNDANLNTTDGINIVLDGGGSALADGTMICVEVPFDATITEARLLSDVSGSVSVDWWKDSYANYPPTDADSITASATPATSSAISYSDATLTGWTTSIAAEEIVCAVVEGAATTTTRVTAVLKVQR